MPRVLHNRYLELYFGYFAIRPIIFRFYCTSGYLVLDNKYSELYYRAPDTVYMFYIWILRYLQILYIFIDVQSNREIYRRINLVRANISVVFSTSSRCLYVTCFYDRYIWVRLTLNYIISSCVVYKKAKMFLLYAKKRLCM